MNAEAIEWLESRPFDYNSGFNYYDEISCRVGEDIGGDTIPCIQTTLFDLKEDHEISNTLGYCYHCNPAKANNTLWVVD